MGTSGPAAVHGAFDTDKGCGRGVSRSFWKWGDCLRAAPHPCLGTNCCTACATCDTRANRSSSSILCDRDFNHHKHPRGAVHVECSQTKPPGERAAFYHFSHSNSEVCKQRAARDVSGATSVAAAVNSLFADTVAVPAVSASASHKKVCRERYGHPHPATSSNASPPGHATACTTTPS